MAHAPSLRIRRIDPFGGFSWTAVNAGAIIAFKRPLKMRAHGWDRPGLSATHREEHPI
jgi:hypothetical protein